MPRSFRNSFNSGVLDPKLAARADLEQWRTGLRTGTNFLLLPHGGALRRPGLRFVRAVSQAGALSTFRFDSASQYLLHFSNLQVSIFDSTGDLITRVVTPYATADLPDLYLARQSQTADTRIVCHQDHAPRRLLRAALKSTNPIRTNMTNPDIVRVYLPDHDLFTGDTIGLSGLTDVGGIDADEVLNQPHEVVEVSGSLGAAPLTVTSGSTTVVANLGADYDFDVGDRISFKDLVTVAGIPVGQLNRIQTITAVSGNTVSFAVESEAGSNTTGGGSVATWRSVSFFEIDIAPEEATSATNGGGTAGRAWIFHSLEPNEDRKVALTNLPQFDYEDALSPPPKQEVQELTFTNFLDEEEYELVISVAGNVTITKKNGEIVFATPTIQTGFIHYAATAAENVARLESAINTAIPNSDRVATVKHKTGDTYQIIFERAVDYDEIQVRKIRSATGTIDVETVVEGGTREEDIISDTRGWPAGCIFYGRRLWFFGITSRPATILASQTEDFFNFRLGSALDGEAIDATGEFDRVRHMIGEKALFLLTSGSEVVVAGGGDDAAVTPTNVNLRVQGRYGSSAVVPVSVAGRPMYIDSTGRTVRQLGASADSASGELDSKDASILSQHLFTGPAGLEIWRNDYGDFVFVPQDDGSAAVLSIHLDQGVAGWTKITTDGKFKSFAEVAGDLYAVVERTIDGGTVYYVERFDFDAYTDACFTNEDMNDLTEASGLAHLEGEAVQVRADQVTMDAQTVDSGAVPIENGGVPIETVDCEVGLAIPTPTLEPMPPQTEQFTSIARVAVDLYASREVSVNGYRLRDYLPGEAVPATGLSPAITGYRAIQVRGWGDRVSVTITAPNPQPCHVRAVDFEVV